MPYTSSFRRAAVFKMEASKVIRPSPTSRLSPDGTQVATVRSNRVEVRTVKDLDLVCSFTLPVRRSKFICLAWAPATSVATANPGDDTTTDNSFTAETVLATPQVTRLLYATTESVYVYDITDPAFLANISNGSGGLGPISHANFGFDDTEVMVWTALGASICVWSLETGRMIAELKDPKHFISGAAVAKGCSWRMTTDASGAAVRGPFALLTRVGAQDVITLWHPTGTSYEVLHSWEPKTTDAQGIKWNPAGHWLVTWDAAAMGYDVLITTAEGHLIRRYSSDHYWREELHGLGARMVECAKSGSWLAIAGYTQSIILLDSRKLVPATHFYLPEIIRPSPERRVYQEVITSGSSHSYITPTNAISAPALNSTPAISTTTNTKTSAPTLNPIQKGASILSFSPSDQYLVCRDDSHPTTLYIWEMRTHDLCAVLIQHSVIKSVSWSNDLLLLTCDGKDSEGIVYTWDTTTLEPGMLEVHSVSGVNFVILTGKVDGEQKGHSTPHIVDGEATVTTGLEDTFQNVRMARDSARGSISSPSE